MCIRDRYYIYIIINNRGCNPTKHKKMTYTEFIEGLPYFPSNEQIDAASNAAQTAVTEYVLSYDEEALVTVYEGEVSITSEIKDDLCDEAQEIFDDVFGDYIGSIQDAEMAKSEINQTLLDSIIKDNYDGRATYCIDDYEECPESWDPIFKIGYDELTNTEKVARRAVISEAFNLY